MKLAFRPGNVHSHEKKTLFEASERRIAEMAGYENGVPIHLIPDNSVHIQRTSAKKTPASQNRFTYNRQCQVRQKLQNIYCILNGAQLTSDDRAVDAIHWRMLYFCCLETR